MVLVQVTKAHNVEGKKGMQGGRHRPASSIMTVSQPDAPLVDVTDDSREEEGGIQEVKDMEDTSPHPTSSIMTVSRPDSRLIDATDNSGLEEVEIPEVEQAEGGLVELPLQARWSESLADGSVTSLASEESVSWRTSDRLFDNKLVTSLASEETVKWRHPKCVECDPELEMERGPSVQFNPGPPFAVGDILLCDVEEFGLQKGLVTRADHPSYEICLDCGHVVDTSVTSAVLFPSYAEWEGNTNKFAPYVEPDIFTKLQQEISQSGSYGMHINAQNTALRLVDEAKAYAKAVKADDAGIPMQLWNDRISFAGVGSEVRGVALTALCKLGWLWFMKSLMRDCIGFMKEMHGADWERRPRKGREGITELGRGQTAIMSLLWYSAQTDWFEYTAGSRLAFFHFPTRYQKLARDGVPIYLSGPGQG